MKNKLRRFFCAPNQWEDDYYDRISGWRIRMAAISVLCATLIIGGIVCMAVFNIELLKYMMIGLAILGFTVVLSYCIYNVVTGGR